jgi:lipopolysaccharide export system permease protein
MRIIRNYFLREFLTNLTASFVGITFILLLGNLITALDYIVRKGIDPMIAVKSFVYAVPYLLQYSLPLSVLLGILLTMSRFSSDNEIIAIKAAGIGMSRILGIFFSVGIVLSMVLLIMQFSIIPYSSFMSKRILKDLGSVNPGSLIEPGTFIDTFDGFVLFVHDTEFSTLRKIYIYQTGEKKGNIIFAERGEFSVDKGFLRIKLENGFIEAPDMQYRIMFQTHFMSLPITTGAKIEKKIKQKDIKELYADIKVYEKNIAQKTSFDRSEYTKVKAEIHKRYSFSLTALIFILLGFGLAGRTKGRDRSVNLTIIFVTGLAYYVLSVLFQSLVLKERLPVLGIWIPNIVFFVYATYHTYKTCRS